MKSVAIVHYHLRRGGVTRVIENAVAALGGDMKCVVLGGEKYEGDALPATALVEGLGYRREPGGAGGGVALGKRMLAAATEALGGPPDLWHIHNHSLGKNVVFPAALRWLLGEGARVLLQIHDFAEDGRPADYRALRAALPNTGVFAATLYPAAPQAHYAILNERDNGILAAAGVPPERRHLLPNAVSVPGLTGTEAARPFGPGCRYYLYPTRAIRRKNMGELLLLAAAARFAEPGTAYGATLAPDNPVWRPVYEAWVDCARTLDLPVAFALGERHGFPALIRGAEALITTSVAEGFGMAFLEPFLFGKDVAGRDLPEITSGFKNRGVALEPLYTALPVKLTPAEERAFHAALATALPATFEAYGQTPPLDAVDRAFEAARRNDGFDFGKLDEPMQRNVIARVSNEGPDDAVAGRLPRTRPPECVRQNREVVENTFGPTAYGKALRDTYARILTAETSEPAAHDAAAVLNAFLDPARFNLLRT